MGRALLYPLDRLSGPVFISHHFATVCPSQSFLQFGEQIIIANTQIPLIQSKSERRFSSEIICHINCLFLLLLYWQKNCYKRIKVIEVCTVISVLVIRRYRYNNMYCNCRACGSNELHAEQVYCGGWCKECPGFHSAHEGSLAGSHQVCQNLIVGW